MFEHGGRGLTEEHKKYTLFYQNQKKNINLAILQDWLFPAVIGANCYGSLLSLSLSLLGDKIIKGCYW